MKSHNSAFFIREGVRSIFTHGLMSFAAVGIIVACLLIMGSFSLVALNLEAMLGSLERENEVLAFVDETMGEESARRIEPQILQIPNVVSCIFVSREEARASFVARYGNSEIFESVPSSALRHRYQIRLAELEEMRETLVEIEAVAGIVETRADLEIAGGFIAVRNIAGAIALILIAVLLFVSLFIISNTIRLAAFTRREEIAIMKMCGATNGFIRWPFVYEGLILGILGALIAFLLQWGVYTLIVEAVEVSGSLRFLALLPFRDLAERVAQIFLAAGFAVGVGGSLFAIGKFLRV